MGPDAESVSGSREQQASGGSTPSGAPAAPPALRKRIDRATIEETIGLLFHSDQLFEIRVLNAIPKSGWRKARTFAGYFHGREAQKIGPELAQFESWSGVYFTLNPVIEALYARSAGRLSEAKSTASDDHVTCRHIVLFDFDPVRPSGISSTDEEHKAALERAGSVRQFFRDELGWPDPILAISGNGAHLVYRVSLDAADEIVPLALEAAGALFSNESVDVDTTVGNPARICKLYGTLTCKGDDIPERPHRLARVVEVPGRLDAVPRQGIERLVSLGKASVREHVPEANVPATGARATCTRRFDVQSFIDRHGIEIARIAPYQGGNKWVLSRCPMDASHEVDKAAFIAQFPSGALSAGCHHDRCTWGWRELRGKYEPRDASPSSSAAASGSFAPALPVAPKLAIGSKVRAHDDGRDNIGTILELGHSRALVHFISPEGHEASIWIKLEDLEPYGDDAAILPPRQITIYTLEELDGLPSQPWILPGVLRRREMAIIYGQSGSAKTFVGIDLVCHLAVGIQWHAGRTPSRPMRCLYISAEGGHEDIFRRVCAWLWGERAIYLELVKLNLRVIPEAVQIVKSGDLEGLLLAIQNAFGDKVQPDLVAFDTLARCANDVEENSSKEMGKLIARLDWLRLAADVAVMLVHHEGKDSSGRERGSSALRGAADLMVRVKKGKRKKSGQSSSAEEEVDADPDLVSVQCDKSKRQRPFRMFRMRLQTEVFEFGGLREFDQDGEPIESASLQIVDTSDDQGCDPEESEQVRVCSAVVEVLRDNFKKDERPSTSDLLAALKSKGVPKNKLYEHRGYARAEELFDWEPDGKATRWSLGPAALPEAAQTELFEGPKEARRCADDSDAS